MKSDLLESIKRYTVKHDRKIQEICEPLKTHLGIPFFTYYFLEEDGRYGTISNNPELMEYYYTQEFYMDNPYMSHPDLFRSGYVFTPCSLKEEELKDLNHKFSADHLFLIVQRTEKKVEGFIFYDRGLDLKGMPYYVANLDLLTKFGRYFKREAFSLINKLHSDQFNMQSVRQNAFIQIDERMPLSSEDRNVKKFLKDVYGLSPQEQRCFELFQQGHSAQSTAAMMGLSRRTVETYFNNIKDKLGFTSKRDLLGL